VRERAAPVTGSLTAAEAAGLAGGELVGDGTTRLSGVAPLDRAGPGELSFLTGGKYLAAFRATRAGAVLCPGEFRDVQPGPATRIVVDNPHLAMMRMVRALFPEPPRPVGVDPTARIGRGAVLGADVYLGPYVVVGAQSRLGERCVVMAGAVLGERVTLGDDVTIHPQVVCYPRTVIGNRVVLHAGTCIGADGFGYVKGKDGHEKVPHVGRVVIHDDVEIGANSCVDRGSIGDTIIGKGTKIDNLVQIGHNVRIGERCIFMGQSGVAGSCVVEDDVMLAGQAGLAGHFTVGRGAIIAAKSGPIGNVARGATVSGFPARDHREFMRATAALYALAPLVRDLEALVERGRREAE
jgi:UDP-3-O-[3-hydroxymyristoyl] glucosamine N-acyltransferase